MRKKLYYAIPFAVIPLIMLSIERFVTPLNIVAMEEFYSALISLFLFSAIIGFFSPSKRKFDYLLTLIVPFALFCTMFIGGFLDKTDVGTRFHLYKAVKTSIQPTALQIYLMMLVTTFMASFKGFRNLKNVLSNKLNSQKRAILKKTTLSTIAVAYDIATVIWYYIVVKNFIFLVKSLRFVGIIGVSDWKAALSIMFKLGDIWDLLLAILFMASNTVIAVFLTRMAFGKALPKKSKILLCVLLGVTLSFFILFPLYTYLCELYALFSMKLISIFQLVYFVILVVAFDLIGFTFKKKTV